MRKVVIVGASGHGKVVADIVQKSGDSIFGFLDDDLALGTEFIGLPVFGVVDDYVKYIRDTEFVIAIGNAAIREKVVAKLKGVIWYTAVHPTAVVSDIDVAIGEGTVVMANAVINAGSVIGKHCIINTGAIVEHDNRISDFVHVSVGSRLGGSVSVGKGTWIGIGASVRNNVTICKGCIVGAGAVAIKNIEKQGIYVGVPAKKSDKSEYKRVELDDTNIISEG